MAEFARWRREVDCAIAFVTGGMMTDDIDFEWARAFARGHPPHEVAILATRGVHAISDMV